MRRSVSTGALLLTVLLVVLCVGAARGQESASFRRGDVNHDGKADIGDAVFTLSYLFCKS